LAKEENRLSKTVSAIIHTFYAAYPLGYIESTTCGRGYELLAVDAAEPETLSTPPRAGRTAALLQSRVPAQKSAVLKMESQYGRRAP
jgi:hypothetical protein